MARIRRALVSVSDKRGVIELGRALAELGVEILSTGGTATALAGAGIAVKQVSDYTGSPEILEGRVKTLHPKIHGGLLGRPVPAHEQEMAAHGIGPIDLVAVNLYPFEATIAKDGVSLDEAIENIDIGGPSMLRSAAKNHERVAVVVDPDDYAAVIAELRAGGGELSAPVEPLDRRQLEGRSSRFADWSRAIVTAVLLDLDERPEVMSAEQGLTYLLTRDLAFAKAAGAMWDTVGAEVRAKVEASGKNTITKISEDEKARWVEATAPVRDKWVADMKAKGLDGEGLIKAAQDMIQKYAKA